ncbi:MAG: ribosome biogenesis GTPase Der [Pseudomonadota bacterium]
MNPQPVIALVGRPNVGKSTLFNQLTRTRDALVADQAGLTRDRQYGIGQLGGGGYLVIDTGGLSGRDSGIDGLIQRQVQLAVTEADHVILVLDARSEPTTDDQQIAADLRRTGKIVTLALNKSENLDPTLASIDFHILGLGQPHLIAAAHGRGVKGLIQHILPQLAATQPIATEAEDTIRIAVIGRPNVGKSTLINRLLGEERVLAYDQPGTTRDTIAIAHTAQEQAYVLLDTAGVRRRARVHEQVEKYSVLKTLQAMQQANVVLLVLDAHQGVSEQDMHLAGHILDAGRALVVVINKWDGLTTAQREQIREELDRRLGFLRFATWHEISALHGSGVGHLLASAQTAYRAAMREFKTSELTDILRTSVLEHQPPTVRGRRIRLRYAHQGGKNPPLIVIHGNQTESVPETYRRFLLHRFRAACRLQGTPLNLVFRTGDNPYAGKRNQLTDRQRRKRQRLMRHVKR